MAAAGIFDVVVVGGGPAGSVMAWSLARRGVRVAVLERATFPREKSSIFAHLAQGGAQAISDLMSGRGFRSSGLVGDKIGRAHV